MTAGALYSNYLSNETDSYKIYKIEYKSKTNDIEYNLYEIPFHRSSTMSFHIVYKLLHYNHLNTRKSFCTITKMDSLLYKPSFSVFIEHLGHFLIGADMDDDDLYRLPTK